MLSSSDQTVHTAAAAVCLQKHASNSILFLSQLNTVAVAPPLSPQKKLIGLVILTDCIGSVAIQTSTVNI